MAFVFSLISFITGMAVILGFKMLLSIEITSCTLFYILPIGSITAGMLLGFGYPMGMRKFNIKSSWIHFTIALLIGILMFAAVQYGYYRLSYVRDDLTFNYRFQGTHISEFSFPISGEKINFLNFTIDRINSQTITFSRKVINEMGSEEGLKAFNWLLFGVELLGFLLGIFLIYSNFFESTIYCDLCRKYMKEKKVLKLVDGSEQSIDDIKTSVDNNDASSLLSIVQSNPADSKAETDYYIEGILYYCEACNNGYLILQRYVKKSKRPLINKNNYVYDSKADITLKLTTDIVGSLI